MDIQGKVIVALPERSGVSARGEWKSQDFVIETHDAYPRKMVFSVFGADRLARFNIQVGQEVMVSFDIDAHEYNGRWFNNIRAFDVRPVDPASVGAGPIPQAAQPFVPGSAMGAAPTAAPVAPQGGATAPFPPTTDAPAESSADDLPF
ncbi:MAG: DUF3127 domain-containing protein [Prevotella sp.]|jgi:hypothetical protein|nr:DUF3127 domain-containing protein [Prevotella sp.]MCI2080529.1 DUF3127 domain-containing protein [Prevotella sp.]MCI2102384.1 DUF3127 domain-containing protein [Prevotella sp.]